MNHDTKLEQSQINHCCQLIGKIGFDEQKNFLSTVNTENQIDVHLFEHGVGVYFSYCYEDIVRIDICFEWDTDKFNGEIIELVQGDIKYSR